MTQARSAGEPPVPAASGTTTPCEIEFRAQIEYALAAGLRPTHLDWHSMPTSRLVSPQLVEVSRRQR